MTTTMTMQEVLAAFSDYDNRVTGYGAKALDSTVAYFSETIWPAVDALLESDEEWNKVKPSVLNDRGRKAAKAAKLEWTMTEEKLADALRVRRLHTVERLAIFSGWAARESMRKESKRTVKVDLSTYRRWLGEVDRKERDDNGDLTKKGKDAAATRKSNAAALATAVIASDTDFAKDIKGAPSERLATVRRYITNLKVLEIQLVEEVGEKESARIATVITNARKAAAGIA